jgi:rhamnosyltransferase
MKNNTSIAILLATFNSAAWLSQQIESILSQTNSDWTLYINDDGSKDNTLNIIDSYINNYNGKILLLNLNQKNLGAALNFQALLNEVDSSYYMFCDHDDVWLPGKIEVTFKAMRGVELKYPGTGILVHTDLSVVDDKLSVIHPSFYKYSKTNPIKFCSFNYLGVANCVTGCTLMINNAVKEIVPPIPVSFIMHDWWIALNISKKGIIFYVPEQTILYRQHTKNVVGAKRVGIQYLFGIIFNLRKTLRIDIKNYRILKLLGYGSALKYVFYKILFQLKRYVL